MGAFPPRRSRDNVIDIGQTGGVYVSAEIITMLSTGVALLAVMLGALYRQDARLERLEARLNARFEKVDARFDKVDARFEKVDARFEKVDARFDTVDERFQRLEGRVGEIAVDVGTIKGRLARNEASEQIGAQLRELLSDGEASRRRSSGDGA